MLKISKHLIPQMTVEALNEALEASKNKKIQKLLKDELARRQIARISRPLKIEDFLG